MIIIMMVLKVMLDFCHVLAESRTISSMHGHLAIVQCMSQLCATSEFGLLALRNSSAASDDRLEIYLIF